MFAKNNEIIIINTNHKHKNNKKYFQLCVTVQGLTDEGGGARAEAGEGQQAVPRLLHAHYHVVLGVQEGRNQLQAVAL